MKLRARIGYLIQLVCIFLVLVSVLPALFILLVTERLLIQSDAHF